MAADAARGMSMNASTCGVVRPQTSIAANDTWLLGIYTNGRMNNREKQCLQSVQRKVMHLRIIGLKD